MTAPFAPRLSNYDTLTMAAAAELQKALQNWAGPGAVTLAAIPTRGRDNPGRLVVVKYPDQPPAGCVIVHPSDNGASPHEDWGWVPAANLASVVWKACRRQAILPVD